MAEFTKEIEDKIRGLGLALKLQMDFAAAADMRKPEDQMQFAQNNMKAGLVMVDLIKELGIKMTDDNVLEEIVAFAEKNGSDAGKVLKEQAPKMRAINTAAAALFAERAAEKKQITPDDMNSIFRKHLAP